jgi:hypothetical protein
MLVQVITSPFTFMAVKDSAKVSSAQLLKKSLVSQPLEKLSTKTHSKASQA